MFAEPGLNHGDNFLTHQALKTVCEEKLMWFETFLGKQFYQLSGPADSPLRTKRFIVKKFDIIFLTLKGRFSVYLHYCPK